ncbi:MAG: SigE family RNA polymerase sigma factor [Nocardioides sp.]|uniref:SigE family RNA polymerase sigma factor n=1 Tax=Nocardioides sp. TaxID=35761 RepID=UPI0032656D64
MEDEAFTTYVGARWGSLVRSLVLLGCEPHEAEDVTQTALIRCYQSWDRVVRADDPDAYVYRTLLNCWRKSRRRKWWGERPVDLLPEPAGSSATDDVDLRELVDATLGQLSADHRAVLVLRFVADLTEAQTASVLDVPVGTVKSRTARALATVDAAQLREELS